MQNNLKENGDIHMNNKMQVPIRGVAGRLTGWTMSTGPEAPGGSPTKMIPLVWGPLAVLCPWAPEGLATPVVWM